MKRYQQQIILPEIGLIGQQQIANSSVLIIGAGGLGVVVASYLVSMGIGKIGICDFDSIEESNLHRQLHFTHEDIGKNKSTILAQKLRLQNQDGIVEDIFAKISEENIGNIAQKYQIICDCTDQSESRILIDSYCETMNIPLVHGAVSNWQGYVTVFHYKEKIGLKDVFDLRQYFKTQNCLEGGVCSPICGIIGSYMANEVIKIILGGKGVIESKLLYINSLENIFRVIKMKKSIFSTI